jgi:3-phosphoshikimate 1-carboxyvinyltransferase
MLRLRPSVVSGHLRASPSKSYTHRALLMGYLTRRPFTVEDALVGADTMATINAIRTLGGTAYVRGSKVVLEGRDFRPPVDPIDAMNSGTTLRLFAALVGLLEGTTRLTGDESLRRRPMSPLLEALEQLGARCESDGGRPPVAVTGPMGGTAASIRGDVSSQFISGLLIACPLKATATDLEVLPPVKSHPYVEITLAMLDAFGVEAMPRAGGYHVPGGQAYGGSSYRVPGDFSSAAFPLVAAAITGGEVTLEGFDRHLPQGDARILDLLRAFGANVAVEGGRAAASQGPLVGGHVDVSETPDLFPILAVLAAYAEGESVLSGGEHLRYKESDRIRTTTRFLGQMGAWVKETPDGCVVHGGRPLRGALVDCEGDHRILMAAAVAALGARGETLINHPTCYEVSYPRFLGDLRTLGADAEVVG